MIEQSNATRQAKIDAAFNEWFKGNEHIHGAMRNAFKEVFERGWIAACLQNSESNTVKTSNQNLEE